MSRKKKYVLRKEIVQINKVKNIGVEENMDRYHKDINGCRVDKLFKGRDRGISIFDKQSKQIFVVDSRESAEVVLDKFFGLEKKRLSREIKSLEREFRNLRF